MLLIMLQQVDAVLSKQSMHGKIIHLLTDVINLPRDEQEKYYSYWYWTVSCRTIHTKQLASSASYGRIAVDTESSNYDKHGRGFRFSTSFFDLLDSISGLLDELLAEDCINSRQKQILKADNMDRRFENQATDIFSGVVSVNVTSISSSSAF